MSNDDLLAGRYRIERPLGQGGMGRVFLARDLQRDALVAVKVMHAGRAHPEAVARFRREARAAARIDHPVVVRTLDLGVGADGAPFLVMDYAPGTSLGAVLKRRGALSTAATLLSIHRMLEGVEAAHAAGVIHRDLKPDNVLLTHASATGADVRIVDFGISRVAEADDGLRTAAGQILGTPEYMSLEQATGEEIDARTDIYAVGAIAYACATGRSPYAEVPTHGVLAALTSRPPRPIAEVAPDVPIELAQWIEKAMARELEERFHTARAARSSLLTVIDGIERAATEVVDGAPPMPLLDAGAMDLERLMVARNEDGSAGRIALEPTLPAAHQAPKIDAPPSIAAASPSAVVSSAPRSPPWRAREQREGSFLDRHGAKIAIAIGALSPIPIFVMFGQGHWRGPLLEWAQTDPVAIVFGEGVIALAWALLGAAALRLGAARPRTSTLILAFSQVLFRSFSAVRAVRPEWTDQPIVATIFHGSVMGTLAGGAPLGLWLAGIHGRRLNLATRAFRVAALAVVAVAGTRLWSSRDAHGLHAGPVMLVTAPVGALITLGIGVALVRAARAARSEERRRRVRAGGLGFVLMGLLTCAEALPYLGIHTGDFTLVGLVPIALLADAALEFDAFVLANPRALAGLIGGIQTVARAMVALPLAGFILLLAHDARAELPWGRIAGASVGVVVSGWLAWFILTLPMPTIRTALSGTSIGAFAVLQSSVIGDLTFVPSHALWMSRVGNAFALISGWAGVLAIRRSMGRVREEWIEPALGIAILLLIPIALSPDYFVDTKRFAFGDYPQAGWLAPLLDAFFAIGLLYALFVVVESSRRAIGAERRARMLSAGGLALLGVTMLGDILPTLGIDAHPSSDIAFVPLTLITLGLAYDDAVEVRSLVRVATARTLAAFARVALAAMVVGLVVLLLHRQPFWLVAIASAMLVMLLVEPLSSIGLEWSERVLGLRELDFAAVDDALTRMVEAPIEPASLGGRIARSIRAHSILREVRMLMPTAAHIFTDGVRSLPFESEIVALLRAPVGGGALRLGRDGSRPLPLSLRGDGERAVLVGCRTRRGLVGVLMLVPKGRAGLREEVIDVSLARVGSRVALVVEHQRLMHGATKEIAPSAVDKRRAQTG